MKGSEFITAGPTKSVGAADLMLRERVVKRKNQNVGLVRQAPSTSQQIIVRRSDAEILISFAPEKFSTPTQGIVADYASAMASQDGVKLLFSKENPISHRAVMLVEVGIAWSSFYEALIPSITGGFLDNLKSHIKDTKAYAAWKPTEPVQLSEAPYHSRRASLANIAYSRDEAVIDFHLVSTADLAQVIMGNASEVAVDAVLRVLLPTPLLHKLMLECEAIAVERPRAS